MTTNLTDSSQRPISSLNLPHFLKAALKEKEYRVVGDLHQVSAEDLVTELNISRALGEDILRALQEPIPSSSKELKLADIQSSTATALLTQSSIRFSTLSTSIDSLISNFSSNPHQTKLLTTKRALEKTYDGVQLTLSLKGKESAWSSGQLGVGMVLEVAGAPGAGKTAVAVGLVMSARLGQNRAGGIDDQLGKGEGAGDDKTVEVLIIDTEGGITPLRLRQAAQTLRQTSSPTVSEILAGIHIARIATQVQMIAFLHTLENWLDIHPKVRLVVIDTLSYHFRQPNLDVNTRKRIMDLAKQQIAKAATVHRCSIVITNQLATKLLTAENKPATFETGDRAVLMPQLGESWTTEKTVRLLLFRGGPGDDLRYAHASSTLAGHDVPWACFDIDNHGLPCDVPPIPSTSAI